MRVALRNETVGLVAVVHLRGLGPIAGSCHCRPDGSGPTMPKLMVGRPFRRCPKGHVQHIAETAQVGPGSSNGL